MRLRRQPLEVIDKSRSAVFSVLVVTADVDRFVGTNFLAVAAEYAAELVNLEDQRIPVSLFVFAGHELDAVRRTDGGTQSAGDTFRFPRFRRQHPVRTPPPRRDLPLLLRILNGHLALEEMLERERHSLD